jgi:hypothetical protein
VFAHPHLWLCIYPTPGGAALVLDCSDAVSVLTRGESSSTGFCCDVEMDDLKSFVVDCAADARKCVPSLHPTALRTEKSLVRFGFGLGDELTPPFYHPRPISLTCTNGYTYAAKVWALCFVQGPF